MGGKKKIGTITLARLMDETEGGGEGGFRMQGMTRITRGRRKREEKSLKSKERPVAS